MDSAMTDDMLSILEKAGLRETVMKSITDKIEFHLSNRHLGQMKAAAVTFSKVTGMLGCTEHSEEILQIVRKEYQV